MTKILTIADWYLPAYKAGGPILSLSNMIATLAGGEFEFHVLTGDRDLGDRAPFSNVAIDSWTRVGEAQVFYTGANSFWNLRRRIAEVQPDVLHLNSFFSRRTIKIVILRKLGLLGATPVVLSPRGEFTPGAFGIKKTKKRLFLRLAALSGLYKDIFWQVSTPREKQDTEKIFSRYGIGEGARIGVASPVHVAGLLETTSRAGGERTAVEKRPGEVSFVFVSRVSPKKNLETAVQLVSSLKGNVRFDIYGPVDDPAYWEECKADIAMAPENVTIRYLGPLPRGEASKKFLQYHFFLFPTLGENFGHAIIEAWAAACPVIISNQTPWLGLESKRAGWDLPLNDREGWRSVLQHCVNMGGEAYREMSQGAIKFLQEWAHRQNSNDIAAIFRNGLDHSSSLKTNGNRSKAAPMFNVPETADETDPTS
jgi:glycosyltransferase involved in cell wall biosynthesis